MNQPNNPTQLTFVNSKRLQALRDKTAAAPVVHQVQTNQGKEDAKTAHLRRLVQQRLTEILAQLPPGRQRKLFKIRYRVELEELDVMPIDEVARLLNVKPARN